MGVRPPSPLAALACFSALTVAQSGLSLLLLPLYLTVLTPADYGVLALVNVAAALFGAASNLKLDAAMRTHYFDLSHDAAALAEYLRDAFTAALALAVLFCGAMLAVGERVFRLVFAHAEVQFFPAGALAVATAAINGCLAVYFVYLRNRLALWEIVAWQLLVVVGTIVCQLVFVLAVDLGVDGVLLGALLPAALTLLLVCLVRPGIVGLPLRWRRLLPSLRYSLPLVALTACFMLSTRLDRLVLERHVELATVGAYALMVSVLGLQAMVLGALDGAIRPHLFERLKSAGARVCESVDSYQEIYCLVGLMGLSVAIFIGANLQLIADEPGYLAMRDWLPFGATACLPLILGRYYALLHEFHKRSIGLTATVVARLMVLFVLLAVLVPPFGVGGALVAVGAAETLAALLLRALAGRRLPVRPPLRAAGAQIAVFLAGVWGSFYALGERSPPLAGALQFVVVVGLLLAMNRRALRRLVHRDDVEAEPLVS